MWDAWVDTLSWKQICDLEEMVYIEKVRRCRFRIEDLYRQLESSTVEERRAGFNSLVEELGIDLVADAMTLTSEPAQPFSAEDMEEWFFGGMQTENDNKLGVVDGGKK